MSLKEQLAQWWNEKKMQMLTGMEMQIAKYPDGDPRKERLQKTMIEKQKAKIDWSAGNEEGEDGIDNA